MVITGPQKQEAIFGVRAAGFVTFFFFFFDWLVGKQKSCVPEILCLVWSYHLPPGWWLQFCWRTQKTLGCVGLWVGTRTLSEGCTTIWMFLLFLYFLPSLICSRSNLPFGTQGRSRRLNEVYILQIRNGEPTAYLYSRVTIHRVLLSFNLGNRATMTVITSCQNGA